MRSRRFLAGLVVLSLGVATFGLAGCGGLEPVVPYQQITDPTQLYLSLQLNHQFINLANVAPYDTLQLVATPRNGRGEVMTGLPAPTFRLLTASDSQFVTVTPDGLLQARAATDPQAAIVWVSAELTDSSNVKHGDTVVVNVTSGSPTLVANLAFHVLPTDSARSGMDINLGEFKLFGSFDIIQTLFDLNLWTYRAPPLATPVDANGDSIPGLRIYYKSLDSTIAEVSTDGFQIFLHRPGQTRLLAELTAYGVTRSDTLVYTVTWPALAAVLVEPGVEGAPPVFQPADIRIAPYGVVLWQNRTGTAVDVTFDDPTNVVPAPASLCGMFDNDPATWGPGPACGFGNFTVPAQPVDPSGPQPAQTDRTRQFPVTGVYRYHTATGATGRVIVTNDPSPTNLP